MGTSATLSLIVFLSQAAPEFTTSLEHEKHSKLNCEAVCLPEMDIYILDSGFFSLKSAFEIVSQHTVVKSLQLHKCMNPFVFLMCLRKSMPQMFFTFFFYHIKFRVFTELLCIYFKTTDSRD